SGSGPGTAVTTYDANGNIASRSDFDGVRTCYQYDDMRREVVRVEGLVTTVDCQSVADVGATLPAGARKITTQWHPDLRLPYVVTEPGRQTTVVYNGRPDPFGNNATLTCTTAVNRPDGKPVPLACKRVEQALLPSGSVDASVAP